MTKKDAIISAALELLIEKGVHNTPMSAIAKTAGTGMGTIYNYFPNKDLLINDIYIKIKEEEKSVFLDFESTKPIKTQFENYFTSIIDFFIGNSSYFKFMEQLHASPIITKESRDKGGESIEPIRLLLKKGQQDRIIKSIDIEDILMFIGGTVLSFLRWHFNKPKTTHSSIKNQIQMVWDAIKE